MSIVNGLRFAIFFILGVVSTIAIAAQPIELGIDVLASQSFKPLQGKRVGLLTHSAGVNNRGISTIDVLANASEFKLVALFGPEHGIRGSAKANDSIEDTRDAKTGLPIYSLFGKTRRPSAAMLSGLDILVIDLQDIGSRSYTYVATLCYAIEACVKAKIPVIVLDRPNPIGGLMVDGAIRDRTWQGFLAYLPIPYVHGLTIGEIAKMALAEGWLDLSWVERQLASITIIPMRGWNRGMTWDLTGLKWSPTSPNIPSPSAALGYAMTGLGCQLGNWRHGIGTPYPFRFLTYPGKTPVEVKNALEARKIPGLSFVIKETQNLKGEPIQGVYVIADLAKTTRPVELSLHLMQLAAQWGAPRNPFKDASPANAELFNKHAGSTALWQALVQKGARFCPRTWSIQAHQTAEAFQKKSKKYYLY